MNEKEALKKILEEFEKDSNYIRSSGEGVVRHNKTDAAITKILSWHKKNLTPRP